MRAYSLHDALTPSGMLFGDYSDYIAGQDAPIGFEQAILRFIKDWGSPKIKAEPSLKNCLHDTADFTDRVDALQTVPAEHKQRLVKIHVGITHKLRTLV